MGKPKHSDDTRGEQKGGAQRAQGEHGPKTHAAIMATINDDGRQVETLSPRAANDPNRGGKKAGHEAELHDEMIANPGAENDGAHRLFENRTQHDEAEKKSEKNRRSIDIERHDHDPDSFQSHEGHPGHRPATPVHSATIESTGEGGGNRAKDNHAHSDRV